MEETKRSIAEQFADLDNFEYKNHLTITSLSVETIDELEDNKIKNVHGILSANLDDLFFNGDISPETYEEASKYKAFIERCTSQLRENNKLILEASGTLEEKLEQIPDDEWVYVGAHTGWLFIEKCKELREDIREYDREGKEDLEKLKENTRINCERKYQEDIDLIDIKVKNAAIDAQEANKQDEELRLAIAERESKRKLKEKAGNLTDDEQRKIDTERKEDEQLRKEVYSRVKHRNRNLKTLEGRLRKEAELNKQKRDKDAQEIYDRIWNPMGPREVKKVDTIIALYPHGISIIVEGNETGNKRIRQPYDDRYEAAAREFHKHEEELRAKAQTKLEPSSGRKVSQKMSISTKNNKSSSKETDDIDGKAEAKAIISARNRNYYYEKKKKKKKRESSNNYINTTDISGDDINALIKAIVGDKKKEEE